MDLDAAFLSRLQFALTIGFHYIFPVITIGMAWFIVVLQTQWLRTGDETYRTATRLWVKVFGASFAMGVATGITMEFQFGMNWARYSRFVGDIFGAPLAAEGVLAFFLESSFLGILLWGEKRVSQRVYWLSGLMVAVGSTLSAFWIVVANSWQQTPAGFRLVEGRAELVSFSAAVWNPSTVPRFLHTVNGALIAGTFFVLGLSALVLLRDREASWARKSLKVALVMGALAAALEIPLGHYHAVQVTQTQPAKLAAMEGLWETQTNAPLLVFGLPNPERERTDYAVGLPGWLSIGVGGTRDTEVRGLEEFPRDERPPILTTFFSFHLMVGLAFWFVGVTAMGLFWWWRKRLWDSRFFLRLAVLTIPLPILANELGWVTAEVGRQPWVVYGLLRTSEAFSERVPAGQILFSIVGFSVIYALLFALWVYVLRGLLRHGPVVEPKPQEVAS